MASSQPEKPVYVTFVGNGFGRGENPLYWGKLWDGLTQLGMRVQVCSPTLLNCSSEISHCSIGPPPAGFFRLARVIVSSRIDVLMVNEFSALSAFALLAFRITGKKSRSILLVENHPRYLLPYGLQKTGLRSGIYRRLVSIMAGRVLTNNLETAQYLEHELKVAKGKVCTFPYLTSTAPHVHRSAPEGRIRIVCVGQLIARKGFSLLVSSIARLPKVILNSISVSIYGDGPDYAMLEKAIVQNGLCETIVLKGAFSYEKLDQVWARADFALVPTLGDYRSLVAFEAISSGLPLIISRHDGAHSEVLIEGVNGWIYDPKEKNGLEKCLSEVIRRRSDIPKMGNWSQTLSKAFSSERVLAGLRDLVLQVVEKKRVG